MTSAPIKTSFVWLIFSMGILAASFFFMQALFLVAILLVVLFGFTLMLSWIEWDMERPPKEKKRKKSTPRKENKGSKESKANKVDKKHTDKATIKGEKK